MKILIASDIHGSYEAAKKIIERAKAEGAEQIILLGDVYNHGPRNPLPQGYDPMAVAELLNGLENLTVLKGNCDSEVDEMISSFAFAESAYIFTDGVKVFLTHGHKYNIDNIPNGCGVMIYGHVHTGFIKEINGVITANAGSAAMPKNGTQKSYILLDGNTLYLKNLEGDILEKRGLK